MFLSQKSSLVTNITVMKMNITLLNIHSLVADIMQHNLI